MRHGLLAIGEAGVTGNGKLAVGYWRYTKRQPDLRRVDAAGEPVGRVAQGAYLLAERRLAGSEASSRQVSAFARLGLSDGATTPFQGGWQAGVLVSGAFRGRPDGQLSFGVNQAYLSSKFRLNSLDEGQPRDRVETGIELTYAEPLLPRVTVQPDLQYIFNPSADPSAGNALLVGLRITLHAGS